MAFFYLEILKRMPEFHLPLKDLAARAQILYLPITDLPPKRVDQCYALFCQAYKSAEQCICDPDLEHADKEESIQIWRDELVRRLLKKVQRRDDACSDLRLRLRIPGRRPGKDSKEEDGQRMNDMSQDRANEYASRGKLIDC